MQKKNLKYFLLFFVIGLFFTCSDSSEPIPRQMAYHRIDFPAKTTYKVFDNYSCPFTFDYPDGGEITRDSKDSCWVDINFPLYDCKWHLSYRNGGQTGENRNIHFEEHRKIVYKHIQKATQIQNKPFEVEAGIGTVYEVYGNVGTPMYVFLSDSMGRDIMMGTFYFQTALKNDSLAPVIDYMKGQFSHMLETLEWKEE